MNGHTSKEWAYGDELQRVGCGGGSKEDNEESATAVYENARGDSLQDKIPSREVMSRRVA